MHQPSAIIYGCAGTVLTDEERAFFESAQPLGFILFARNCESPAQIKDLVASLKACVKHVQVPVLIDQEGGRVARLKPPHWRAYPAAWRFVELSVADPDLAARCCYQNARLMAHDLAALGINTDCAPVADLRLSGAHDIIGDRAFGTSPESLIPLARAQAEGLMAGGVMPVLKHIPGHGRAMVDSHESLPIVEAPVETLQHEDFVPFKALADLPMAMTAHIRYTAFDADQPATVSPKVIQIIREEIGFKGLLMTDDLSMKALTGHIGENAVRAIAAGCDIGLHCNGKMDEMKAIAEKIPALSAEGAARNERAFASINRPVDDNVETLLAELQQALPEVYAA
jgi:beta-N-acetylhexosaminidase